MSTELILTNARVVLPDEVVDGTVVVRDGLIAALDGGRSAAPGAVDCEGDWLSPGLVELHTDNIERHLQPRPTVDWPRHAAVLAHDAEFASVGVTTVFDALRLGFIEDADEKTAPYARPVADAVLALRAAGALKIEHRLHLRAEICSTTLADELEAFGPEDDVGVVSVMDHTPGQRQFADPAQFRAYLRKGPGLTEAEIDALFAERARIRAEHGARQEAAAVAAAARCGAVLASHDDTELAHVAVSAANGAKLAEFPTTLRAAQACRDHAITVMMGAPNLLRGGSHSGNVAAADLAEAGLLDALSSDYAPSSLLTAAVRLGREGGDMAAGLARATAAPAQAAGLADRGRIAVGRRADLLRFRETAAAAGAVAVRGVWCEGRQVG